MQNVSQKLSNGGALSVSVLGGVGLAVLVFQGSQENIWLALAALLGGFMLTYATALVSDMHDRLLP